MSAVLHGVYAWMWMLEVDLAASNGVEYLQYNVPKVRRGLQEIQRHARWTEEGTEFLMELLEWGWDLVRKGETKLREAHHPEAVIDRWEPFIE